MAPSRSDRRAQGGRQPARYNRGRHEGKRIDAEDEAGVKRRETQADLHQQRQGQIGRIERRIEYEDYEHSHDETAITEEARLHEWGHRVL